MKNGNESTTLGQIAPSSEFSIDIFRTLTDEEVEKAERGASTMAPMFSEDFMTKLNSLQFQLHIATHFDSVDELEGYIGDEVRFLLDRYKDVCPILFDNVLVMLLQYVSIRGNHKSPELIKNYKQETLDKRKN